MKVDAGVSAAGTAAACFSKIVIAGGGIIGNSIAYYLADQYSMGCTVVDPVGIAPAASGKAGGFLARDWSDGSVVGPLQCRSFDLHAELGSKFGPATTDYRRMRCEAVAVSGNATPVDKPSGKKLESVEWVNLGVVGSRSMGDESTIAQVHPRKLCHAMWNYVSGRKDLGSTLVKGRVQEAVLNDDGTAITGVRLDDGTVLEADALVVACGPWTDSAKTWFGSSLSTAMPRMFGVKYHSLLVPAPRVLSQAVFFQGAGDPEVYPRSDGDCYVTGFPDNPTVVQELPGEEQVRSEVVSRLMAAMSKVSTEIGGIEPHTKQACYLPTTQDGIPIIGAVPGVTGAFVCSGHSCWGILNGPASGEAMADLLVSGETKHVDISPFAVDRFLVM